VAAPAQLLDQGGDVQLRAALHERHLSVGDDDAADGVLVTGDQLWARWQSGS
jgi:hypothetical protein